jgi:hypothetical protein
MSIWDGLEAAAETLRKADKISEYKEILSAVGTIRVLEDRLSEANQRIRQLQGELDKKSNIEGPTPPFGYFFNPKHPDSPICPKCYQSKTPSISFMTEPYDWRGRTRRDCRNCHHTVWETPTRQWSSPPVEPWS